MEQQSFPPVPRRGRLPVGKKAGPAGLRAFFQWTPPRAPSQVRECRLQTLYSAIPLPKHGMPWHRWLTRDPMQNELLARVETDFPALLEAGDAA